MDQEPGLLAPTWQLLGRLRALVVESLTEKMRKLSEDVGGNTSVDLADVQTRAASSLAVLDVLDSTFDDLQISKLLHHRISALAVPWDELATSLAKSTRVRCDPDVEGLVMSLLRSPVVQGFKSDVLMELDACVELVLQEARRSSLTSSLPPAPATAPARASPQSPDTVVGFEDLMYVSTGPSLADLEGILANVASEDEAVSVRVR